MFIIYKENTGRAELLCFHHVMCHTTSVCLYSFIRCSLNFDLFIWSETKNCCTHTHKRKVREGGGTENRRYESKQALKLNEQEEEEEMSMGAHTQTSLQRRSWKHTPGSSDDAAGHRGGGEGRSKPGEDRNFLSSYFCNINSSSSSRKSVCLSVTWPAAAARWTEGSEEHAQCGGGRSVQVEALLHGGG